MEEKNINTTVKLKQSTKPQAELEKEIELAYRKIGGKLTDIFIPDAFRAAFGDPMTFSVNGVRIEIPIGKNIKVPEAHAKHAQKLMKGAVLNKSQPIKKPSEIYGK